MEWKVIRKEKKDCKGRRDGVRDQEKKTEGLREEKRENLKFEFFSMP